MRFLMCYRALECCLNVYHNLHAPSTAAIVGDYSCTNEEGTVGKEFGYSCSNIDGVVGDGSCIGYSSCYQYQSEFLSISMSLYLQC